MRVRKKIASLVAGAICAVLLTACGSMEDNTRLSRYTLVVGIDVSGSFRSTGNFGNAIEFAANYIYCHLNGLGELRQPTALFVGPVGGSQPGEAQSYQPIHAFQNKSVDEIAAMLTEQFPADDALTDFNVFFDRVASLVQRHNLVLSPLDIVIFSDGIHDVPGQSGGEEGPYHLINLDPLEYLSRSVTVRLLYASPTVSVDWERKVERQRVRMWTVDAQVMGGWKDQLVPDLELDVQENLLTWINENVDFRVRSRRF
ncbi:hypothetical protein ACFL41_00845 [Gemmatimonadota bacterium]